MTQIGVWPQLTSWLHGEENQVQSSANKAKKLCRSLTRTCTVLCGMEKRSYRGTSNSMRSQMEVQPKRSTPIWRSMGLVGDKLQKGNVCKVGEQINHRKCFFNNHVYCTARTLTPISSDINDLEAFTPNHFLLGKKNVCLPYVPCTEEFFQHRNFFATTSLCKSDMGQIS